MRLRDGFVVFMAALGLLVGVYSPQLAEPLAFLPRLLLMLMLFLGFLSVGVDALWLVLRAQSALVCKLIVLRLFILPILCFIPFRFLFPDFALGAFLLAAAPVGVMAGVYSLMVHANTALILVGNITTSLLLPLSLPLMLFCLRFVMDALHLGGVQLPEHLSLGGMTLSLCFTILVPFILAWLIRVHGSTLAQGILRRQYPVSVSCVFLSNVAIFSQYADILFQNPALIISCLLGAFLLCALMTVLALPLARREDGPTGLAEVISFGTVNNILIMILSMEFFSATEALLAAAYLVPLYLMLLYYRHYARRHGIADV